MLKRCLYFLIKYKILNRLMIGVNAQKKSLILLMSAVTTAATGSSIDNYNSLI